MSNQSPSPKARAVLAVDEPHVRKLRELMVHTSQTQTVKVLRTDASHIQDILTNGRFSRDYVERVSKRIDEAHAAWAAEQKGAAE